MMSPSQTRTVMATAPAVVRPEGTRRHGLIIVADQHPRTELHLPGAARDGEAMQRLMIDPACGCFDEDAVKVLRGKQVTVRNIRVALAELKRRSGPGDTAWVYYVGHAGKEGEEAYWITEDTDLGNLEGTAIAVDEVSQALARVRASRLFVFLDCCHAATFPLQPQRTRGPLNSAEVLDRIGGEGRLILASSGRDQRAVESDRGAFSLCLERGLCGDADEDQDGVVSLTELWSFLAREVPRTAQHMGGKQEPVLKGEQTPGLALTFNKAFWASRREAVAAVKDRMGFRADDLTPEEASLCLALLHFGGRTKEEHDVLDELGRFARGETHVRAFRALVKLAWTSRPGEPPWPGAGAAREWKSEAAEARRECEEFEARRSAAGQQLAAALHNAAAAEQARAATVEELTLVRQQAGEALAQAAQARERVAALALDLAEAGRAREQSGTSLRAANAELAASREEIRRLGGELDQLRTRLRLAFEERDASQAGLTAARDEAARLGADLQRLREAARVNPTAPPTSPPDPELPGRLDRELQVLRRDLADALEAGQCAKRESASLQGACAALDRRLQEALATGERARRHRRRLVAALTLLAVLALLAGLAATREIRFGQRAHEELTRNLAVRSNLLARVETLAVELQTARSENQRLSSNLTSAGRLAGDATLLRAENQRLQQQLTTLQGLALAAQEEKSRLATNLVRIEAEAAQFRARLDENRQQMVVLSQEKERAQEHALTLAKGLDTLADKSQNLATEIREDRQLAPNTIYKQYLDNRVDSTFRASRPGVLGLRSGDVKTAKTVLFRDAGRVFAVLHIRDTPIPAYENGPVWTTLTGSLSRAGTNDVTNTIESLSFVSTDPRILVLSIEEAAAASLGVKPFDVSEDPAKLQDAVVVCAEKSSYGEVEFKPVSGLPRYVKIQRRPTGDVFGNFSPSKADLAFSKSGELLGMMVNSQYCVLLKSMSATRVVQLGTNLTGQSISLIGADVARQLQALPMSLQ